MLTEIAFNPLKSVIYDLPESFVTNATVVKFKSFLLLLSYVF